MSGAEFEEPTIDNLALEGLGLANSGDYGDRFQRILDALGAGIAGQTPTAEGLALKALYHQSREVESGNVRELGALREITIMYSDPSIGPELSVSPIVISALAIALNRATYIEEVAELAATLSTAAERLREHGYPLPQPKDETGEV